MNVPGVGALNDLRNFTPHTSETKSGRDPLTTSLHQSQASSIASSRSFIDSRQSWKLWFTNSLKTSGCLCHVSNQGWDSWCNAMGTWLLSLPKVFEEHMYSDILAKLHWQLFCINKSKRPALWQNLLPQAIIVTDVECHLVKFLLFIWSTARSLWIQTQCTLCQSMVLANMFEILQYWETAQNLLSPFPTLGNFGANSMCQHDLKMSWWPSCLSAVSYSFGIHSTFVSYKFSPLQQDSCYHHPTAA